MSERLEIRRMGEGEGRDKNGVNKEIYEGLRGSPKDISSWPKYLYDERGSELFEEITRQPEYYQTRTELSILKSLPERIDLEGSFQELVELGSGSASKTRALLKPIVYANSEARYIPLDVSESALTESADKLLEEYPSLRVSGYVGDFDGNVQEFLTNLPESEGPRLVIFLGGTMGNFSSSKRMDFLKGVRGGLSSGDRFLLGLDLVKDHSILEAAYNDAAGVTAEFNKNVLRVLNRQLLSDFDPGLFSHRAVFNANESRIEMWLDSVTDQKIHVPAMSTDIEFSCGEGIRTEVSNKFTRGSIEEMFKGSGLDLVDLYTDEDELFGLALAKPE